MAEPRPTFCCNCRFWEPGYYQSDFVHVGMCTRLADPPCDYEMPTNSDDEACEHAQPTQVFADWYNDEEIHDPHYMDGPTWRELWPVGDLIARHDSVTSGQFFINYRQDTERAERRFQSRRDR